MKLQLKYTGQIIKFSFFTSIESGINNNERTVNNNFGTKNNI